MSIFPERGGTGAATIYVISTRACDATFIIDQALRDALTALPEERRIRAKESARIAAARAPVPRREQWRPAGSPAGYLPRSTC